MNKLKGILILCTFLVSCSSNLDFNQTNDLNLKPTFIANFGSFIVPANRFIVNGIEQTKLVDILNFKVFNGSDFNKNLIKSELNFEFNNTINRGFNIDIHFLDANDVVLHSIPVPIAAYTGMSNSVKKTESFENSNLDLLKQTQKIAFIVSMLPGTAITDSTLGIISMRSSATLYFATK